MPRKYYKIIPTDETTAIRTADSEITAICDFATEMELDMSRYFKAVEISEAEYNDLAKEGYGNV